MDLQTDADAVLPSDYFFRNLPVAGAALFPFKHVSKTPRYKNAPDFMSCIWNIMKSLYPKVGSIFGFTSWQYDGNRSINLRRGPRFPQEKRGRDFYMLNKIRKLTQIKSVKGAPIEIEARLSDECPSHWN